MGGLVGEILCGRGICVGGLVGEILVGGLVGEEFR